MNPVESNGFVASPVTNQSNATWSNRAVTATSLSLAGVSAGMALNYMFPCSWGSTLFRHVALQTPALLYGLTTSKIDSDLKKDMHRGVSSMYRKEACISQKEKICNVDSVVWLNNQLKAGRKADVLGKTYKEIKGSQEHELLKTIDFLQKSGWDTAPMDKATQFNSKSDIFGNNSSINEFVFYGTVFDECVPIEELKEGEALLCFSKPKPGNRGIAHMSVIYKNAKGSSLFYDPMAETSRSINDMDLNSLLLLVADKCEKEIILSIKVKRNKEDH